MFSCTRNTGSCMAFACHEHVGVSSGRIVKWSKYHKDHYNGSEKIRWERGYNRKKRDVINLIACFSVFDLIFTYHLKGFSPLCTRSCSFRFFFEENILEQTGHRCYLASLMFESARVSLNFSSSLWTFASCV